MTTIKILLFLKKSKRTIMKKQLRKNDERIGFPDISDSQAVILRGVVVTITTIRIFIKFPEEGRLDCPKYRENQFARRFSLLFFLLLQKSVFGSFKPLFQGEASEETFSPRLCHVTRPLFEEL